MQPKMSGETFERLKTYAEPLVDTIDSVIHRALDALDQVGGRRSQSSIAEIRSFNPGAPPSLAHTTLKIVELCGETLKANETYWNSLHVAVIRAAQGTKISSSDLRSMILANWIAHKKEDDGYRHYPELGISIQGQDSNTAWRSIYNIASRVGLKLHVTFTWQNNPKSAFPGLTGRMTINM